MIQDEIPWGNLRDNLGKLNLIRPLNKIELKRTISLCGYQIFQICLSKCCFSFQDQKNILCKFLQCLSVCVCVCYVFVTEVTHPYISAKNKDTDTKLSGYDPWGLPLSSMMSRMTMSSMSPVRNPQCPPSTPMNKDLTPNFPDIIL